jgi:hypothetical protein
MEQTDLNIREVTPLLNINLGNEIKKDLVVALTEKSGGNEQLAGEVVTEAIDLTRTIIQEAKRNPKILGFQHGVVSENFGKMTGEEEALVTEATVLLVLLGQKDIPNLDKSSLFWGEKHVPAIKVYEANKSRSIDKLQNALFTQTGQAQVLTDNGLARVGTTNPRIFMLEQIAEAVAMGPSDENPVFEWQEKDYLETKVSKEKIYTGKSVTRSYTNSATSVRNYLQENSELGRRSSGLKQKIELLLK